MISLFEHYQLLAHKLPFVSLGEFPTPVQKLDQLGRHLGLDSLFIKRDDLRHPMYLSMILVYMGVSIAAASWLFFLLTIVTYFLQRYQMIQEEGYCCEKFGRSYSDYMSRTSRWIGIPRRSNQK